MPMTRCGAEMKRLMDISGQDIDVIEQTLDERLGMGIGQVDAERQAVNEAIAQLLSEKKSILDAVAKQYPELTRKPEVNQPSVGPLSPVFRTVEATPEPEAPKYSAEKPSPAAVKAREFLNQSPVASSFAKYLSDKLYDFSQQPWMLGWFTNSQLGEKFKNLPAVRAINEATRKMSQVANHYMGLSHHIDLLWRALKEADMLEMQKLMLDTTLHQTHVAASKDLKTAWEHESNNHLDRKDAALRAKFEELHNRYWHKLTKEARKVYSEVEAFHTKMRDDRVALVQKNIARTYQGELGELSDKQIESMQSAAKFDTAIGAGMFAKFQTPNQQRALRRLASDIAAHQKEFATVSGPYFPLVRFGDHVVVSRSQRLVEAEAAVDALRKQLEPLYELTDEARNEGVEAQINELRKQVGAAQGQVDLLKKNDKDYSVQFFERPSEARDEEMRLAAANPEAQVYRTLREQYFRGLDSVTPAFFNKLQESLSAAMDAGAPMDARAKADVLGAARDMYLSRSPENAALKAELRRQGIDGVKAAQMRRGFAEVSRSGAWRISRLTHGHEAVNGMNELAADKSIDARSILNEYKKRMAQTMTNAKPNSFLAGINNLSHFMYLGLSPAYFMTNMSQTWVTSLPIMAGRFGMGQTSAALYRASKDVIPLLAGVAKRGVTKDGMAGLTIDLNIDEIAKKLNLSQGEVDLLNSLTENGALDISMRHDVGSVASGESSNITTKMMEISGVITNYPEVYNRLTTALAAYRLEMAHSADKANAHENAVKYADKVIDNTHFNYSEENAPRFMRGNLQRVVFQFKRYQQGMIYLLGKTINDAYKGDKEARRAFVYLMGTNMAVAGAAGLPIAAPIALLSKMIAAMWPDDDEPELLQMAYNGMKDAVGETTAQMMSKGVFSAVDLDLSGSIGLGNVLNPIGFARTQGKETFSQEWFAQAALALAGPGAGLAAKWGQSFVDASKGDVLKAAGEALPRFAANPVKAYQRAEQGVRSLKGDVLMSSEEFGALSLVTKAAGFESADVGDMYDSRSAFYTMRGNKQDARNSILRSYVQARGGDGDMTDVMQKVQEFNTRHPEDRIAQSNLLAAMKQHLQTQREMRGGVRVGQRDTGVADALGLPNQ